MKDTHIESDAAPVFSLAKLARLYKTRLKLLGGDVSGRFNNTHLKTRILAHQQDFQAYREGRDVLLAFSKDVRAALRQAYERDFDDEAWILSQATIIVRRDMFSTESKFHNSFENNCQQESTPQSLRSLVGMILGGSNIFHAFCLYVGALLIISDYSYVVNICFRWPDLVHNFCLYSDSDDMNLSWFAFHAHHEKGTSESNLAIWSLLHLFEEQAASPAMSRHSMDVISKAVQYLNPGQTAVMACDQPFFDITKQIQWISPNSYGEDWYFIMLSGLYIVMIAWKALGKWLDSSGWTAVLVQADIATPGKVEYF